MKSKVLFLFLSLLFPGEILVAFESSPKGEDRSLLVETSMFVSKGTEMTLSGGLTVNYSDLFHNSGSVYFKNISNTYIVLPSGNIGSGEFILNGTRNIELNTRGGDVRVGNLNMDMSGGMLLLKGHLSISGLLKLQNGIIDVGESSSLLIDNSSPEAISFNDSPLNKSYIKGFLSRQISSGNKYFYPVGDGDYYHPFTIDKASKNDVIHVSFDENVPREIRNNDQGTPTGLIESYGWRVESNLNQPNKFIPGLSLYNTSLEENGSLLDIYHLSEVELKGAIVPGKLNGSFLIEEGLNTNGLFAFSRSINTNEFLNFIYVKGDNKTNFEIPYSDDYSNISLKMYNHLGILIYKNEHYANELDVRDFSDGTYFYELILDKEAKQSIVRKFIEIAHEK